MKVLFGLVLLAGLAPVSGAQARSIDDCEKINNPMLYNQCLAEFSPAARRTGSSRPGNIAPAYDPPPRGTVYRRREQPPEELGGIVVQRTKGGRKIATFDVGGPEKARRRRR